MAVLAAFIAVVVVPFTTCSTWTPVQLFFLVSLFWEFSWFVRNLKFRGVRLATFDKVDHKDLKILFFKQLADSPNSEFQKLGQLFNKEDTLNRNKKSLRLSFARQVGMEGVYLVMVNGYNDPALIRLAKSHGLPRGLPILWIPDKNYFQSAGFYPKFENDKTSNFTSTNFTKLEFFKKFSGFLGLAICWEFEGVLWWTVCTKKNGSRSSPYIKNATRILSESMTYDLVRFMVDNGYHFCGEVLSFSDQCHGAPVLQEVWVITCIAKGARSTDSLGKWCHYLPHAQIVEICHTLGLLCDTAIVIDGSKAVKRFIDDLMAVRDRMTDYVFEDILEKVRLAFPKQVQIFPGTTSHQKVLGSTLEGIVANFFDANCVRCDTLKLKCPVYTTRTWGIRDAISNCSIDTEECFYRHVSYTIPKCRISEEGKDYWTPYIWKCREVYLKIQASRFFYWRIYIRLYWWSMLQGNVSVQYRIRNHILVADYVSRFVPILPQKETVDSSKLPKFTVIVFMGIIGSGKSTLANYLAKKLSITHVDGDNLLPGLVDTMATKSERNRLGWGIISQHILHTIYHGGPAGIIISTGGGAFFSNEKLLEKTLADLGFSLDLNVIYPAPVDEVCIPNNTDDIERHLKDMYNAEFAKPFFDDAVNGRIMRQEGTWRRLPDTLLSKIYNTSLGNIKFAGAAARQATGIYLVPIVKDHSSFRPCLPDLKIGLIPASPQKEIISRYVFLLVRFGDVYGHITMEYSPRGCVHQVDQFLASVESWKGKLLVGRFYSDKKIRFIDFDESSGLFSCAHVTINSGPFPPVCMRHITEAIKANPSNPSQLCLKNRKGEDVPYTPVPTPPEKAKKVDVEVIGIFTASCAC